MNTPQKNLNPSLNVPPKTIGILGALEDLGIELFSDTNNILGEILEIAGKKMISLGSDGVEDILNWFFPDIENKTIEELTKDVRTQISKMVKVINILYNDPEFRKDVNEVIKLVTKGIANMLTAIVEDLEKPIFEATEKIGENTSKIVTTAAVGAVRTGMDAFWAALAPIPIIGEIGGIIDTVNAAAHAGISTIPPAINTAAELVKLGNKIISGATKTTNENLDNFSLAKKKAKNAYGRIGEIEKRISNQIQGLTQTLKKKSQNGGKKKKQTKKKLIK